MGDLLLSHYYNYTRVPVRKQATEEKSYRNQFLYLENLFSGDRKGYPHGESEGMGFCGEYHL
jgi:hypothetical protein